MFFNFVTSFDSIQPDSLSPLLFLILVVDVLRMDNAEVYVYVIKINMRIIDFKNKYFILIHLKLWFKILFTFFLVKYNLCSSEGWFFEHWDRWIQRSAVNNSTALILCCKQLGKVWKWKKDHNWSFLALLNPIDKVVTCIVIISWFKSQIDLKNSKIVVPRLLNLFIRLQDLRHPKKDNYFKAIFSWIQIPCICKSLTPRNPNIMVLRL